MEKRHQILVLDDDADWLDACRDFLAQLPSKPEVRTVSSGTRALALLDSQPFRIFLCDLKMPRMDGLQVMTIVRRRFPDLRTVMITALGDTEFRSRAYALGVELFWLKTDMEKNPEMFLECIESLLGDDPDGFRDLQGKNLVNVIQMERALRNSSLLRITSGARTAQIWISDGEIIDARAEGADGDAAFFRILKWKSGAFETLPLEASHAHNRTITKSLEALLMEAHQEMEKISNPTPSEQAAQARFIERMSTLACEGADFVVTVPAKKEDSAKGWGTLDAERIAGWARHAQKTAVWIGEKFGAGPLLHVEGANLEHQLLLLPNNGQSFVVGWPSGAQRAQMFERSKKLFDAWDS